MGRRVRDVMTWEVVSVDEETSLADLLLKEEFPKGPLQDRLFERRRRRETRIKAAGDTAVELMTAPAITVGPDASIAEAARLLHCHRIKRMPVVDPAGPLLGIVSRADLLKVFLRADADIATEIRQQVLVRAMWMDQGTIVVDVRDGVVTLTGRLEHRSLLPIIVSLVRGLDGVVDRLTFEVDDTPIMAPSGLLIDQTTTRRQI
jgi:CBS domain-containing protein